MLNFFDFATTALLTYAMHSLVACVVALAAGQLMRRPNDRDLLWKATLVAPLLSATTALLLSAVAGFGQFVDLGRLARRILPARFAGREIIVQVHLGGAEPGAVPDVVRHFIDPVTRALSVAVVVCVVVTAVIAFVRFIIRRRTLSRALAPRHRVGELTVGDGAVGRVTLSTAADLQSPVAFGAAEICLPTDVANDFSDEHRRSLIAHEVEHLRRRDPAWLLFAEIVSAASAFQPLIFAITRAFRRDVELICDEAAVRHTNDRTALIGALARLASPFDTRSPIFGAATAYDGSPLMARAVRIAGLSLDTPTENRSRRVALFGVAALVAALCVVPAVSAAPRARDFPLDPTDAIRQAQADGRLVTVDTNVVVAGTARIRRRTLVRIE